MERKGGEIPIDYIRRFSTLLRQATSQFYQYFLDVVREEISEFPNVQHNELGVLFYVTDLGRLANDTRRLTTPFKYSRNVRYYTCLKNAAFIRCIYEWIEYIYI